MSRPLVLTTWRSHKVKRLIGRRTACTWGEFVDRFVRHPEIVARKRSVAAFALADFSDGRRCLASLEGVYVLVLDVDRNGPRLDRILRVFRGVLGVVYTSHSHTPDAPRYRAILVLSRPVSADEYRHLWTWASTTAIGRNLDPGAKSPVQPAFLPSHPAGGEYVVRELCGKPLDVDRALRIVAEREGSRPTRGVPWSAHHGGIRPGLLAMAPPGNTTSGGRSLDRSASGVDFRFCLDRMRDGASDDEIADELRARSRKGDRSDYIDRTVERARIQHEAHAPRATVRKATLHCLPARFAYGERRHVALELMTGDGEIVEATIVVPSPLYPKAATTWAACFADIDPAPLLADDWSEVGRVWRSIRWRHRRFEVAVRDGRVVWIRAVGPERKDRTGT